MTYYASLIGMAYEKSPYEGSFNRTGLACIGRITSVDAEGRMLRVKTFQGVDDLDLYNVKILHGLWSSQGDEVVEMPRIGTMGIVLFVGPDPYWLGCVPSSLANGGGMPSTIMSLQEGDINSKTIYGNRVTLRRGGIIEVQSTDVCSTMWTPTQNLIDTICQNYVIQTSNGRLEWRLDKENDNTSNLKITAWNNLSPDNAVVLDIGTVSDDNNEDSSANIKPYDAADLIFDFRQGEYSLKDGMTKRTMRVSVKNDGSFFFDVGPGKFSLTVDASTGDVNFETQGKVTGKVVSDVELSVDGAVTANVKKDVTLNADAAVTATIKDKLTATVTGDVSISTDGAANVSAKGDVSVTAKGAANITASGDATVSASGSATVKGSGSVTVQGSDVNVTASGAVSVKGSMVKLGAGAKPVACTGDQVLGIGNLGAPVIGSIGPGQVTVTAG